MKVFSQSSLLTNVKPKGPLLWRLLTKTYILSLLFCVLIYYWKDHKHTDKNKMTVRDLKKWCWLSYCSPKHYFVRHSGKCSEYHRLDGAGALFSSFASFQYVEELQLLLVKFLDLTNLIYAVFPWNSCRFFKESLVSHVPAKDRKSMKKQISIWRSHPPSSSYPITRNRTVCHTHAAANTGVSSGIWTGWDQKRTTLGVSAAVCSTLVTNHDWGYLGILGVSS